MLLLLPFGVSPAMGEVLIAFFCIVGENKGKKHKKKKKKKTKNICIPVGEADADVKGC